MIEINLNKIFIMIWLTIKLIIKYVIFYFLTMVFIHIYLSNSCWITYELIKIFNKMLTNNFKSLIFYKLRKNFFETDVCIVGLSIF